MTRIIQNRYQIEAILGSGGMGTVYRCLDTHTNERVALKELSAEAVRQDPGLIERFARESEALKLAAHPNIVKVLTTFSENGVYYMVMEYVAGGSLKSLVERAEPVSIRRTLEISLGICDALTRAHHMNIIHRDIKPANVLLDLDGSPRLSDFGVALLLDKETITMTNTVVGTVEYMAPETFNGEVPDFGADLWSLSVVIFEMLTGRRPFTIQGNIVATMMAIIGQPTPDVRSLRPDTPDDLANLVNRLLDKDPTQRPFQARQIALEIDNMLRAVAGHTPIPAGGLADESALALPNQQDNLPPGSDSIVGRDRELDEIRLLFNRRDTRLITIVGPIETGKTALALAAASREKARFPHGAWFVDLESRKTADEAVAAISTAINCPQGEMVSLQALQDFLKRKLLLLVLDHCQPNTMIELIVQRILDSAPGVRCIVTARQPLNLSQEIVMDPGYVKRKDATQILETRIEVYKRFGVAMEEREYWFVQEQVDTGVLRPTEEITELLQISRRQSRNRHLVYRTFMVALMSVLIVITGVVIEAFQIGSASTVSEVSAANLMINALVASFINGIAAIILTILEYQRHPYWKRFRLLSLYMGISIGVLIGLLKILGIGGFPNVTSAFVTGALVGAVLGAMFFLSLPRRRYRRIRLQLRRSFLVGLVTGVGLSALIVAMMLLQSEGGTRFEEITYLWIQIPLTTITFFVSFSLGIEIANRLLLGPPSPPDNTDTHR